MWKLWRFLMGERTGKPNVLVERKVSCPLYRAPRFETRLLRTFYAAPMKPPNTPTKFQDFLLLERKLSATMKRPVRWMAINKKRDIERRKGRCQFDFQLRVLPSFTKFVGLYVSETVLNSGDSHIPSAHSCLSWWQYFSLAGLLAVDDPATKLATRCRVTFRLMKLADSTGTTTLVD